MNHAHLLKLQCSQLRLLIALSQETKRWGERTVIMRKGQLTSVGGEIMPKDPPSFRVLTPEQWIRFAQGDIKNFRDIDRKGDRNVHTSPINLSEEAKLPYLDGTQVIESNSEIQATFNSSMEVINNAIRGIGNKIKEVETWLDPKIQAIKTKIGDAIKVLGVAATIAYNAVTGAFSIAITKAKEAVRSYKEDPEKFKSELKKNISEMATRAVKNIKNAPGKIKDAIVSGVGAAMSTIADFLNILAFGRNRASNFTLTENMKNVIIIFFLKSNLPANLKEKVVNAINNINTNNKGKDITSESRADQVIAIAEQTIKDLNLDKEKIKERLVAEYQRPATSDINTKYTLERRLIELSYLHEKIKRKNVTQLPPALQSKREDLLKRYEINGTVNTSVKNLSFEQQKESYVWHKGIVQAELKYGGSIDELVLSGSLRVKSKYDSLLEVLSEGKPPAQPVDYITKQVNSLMISSLTLEDEVNSDEKKTIEYFAQEAQNILSMSNVRPKIVVMSSGDPRAFQYSYPLLESVFTSIKGFFSGQEDIIKLASSESVINAGSGFLNEKKKRSTAFHETGHAIESKAKLINISTNYINSRHLSLEKKPLKDINDLYEAYETYIPTDFTNQYVGKIHNFSGAVSGTELTSMSVQNLANPNLLRNACKEDREHILYGLFVLDYKPQE